LSADTVFNGTVDAGAEAAHNPYRLGPLTFTVGEAKYVNERAISTQSTAWHFTAHVNPTVPAAVGAILWFGADDTKHSLNVPFYAASMGADDVPLGWSGLDCMGRSTCRRTKQLPGTITDFSLDSAHWLFNLVANYAYTR
jgi:hypothetical protein